MKYRDLEKVRKIIDEAVSLEISYAFDDLVFPDHTAFIIRYDDTDDQHFFCHFHEDCDPEEMKKIEKKLSDTSAGYGCRISLDKQFNLEQKGEQVEIKFL